MSHGTELSIALKEKYATFYMCMCVNLFRLFCPLASVFPLVSFTQSSGCLILWNDYRNLRVCEHVDVCKQGQRERQQSWRERQRKRVWPRRRTVRKQRNETAQDPIRTWREMSQWEIIKEEKRDEREREQRQKSMSQSWTEKTRKKEGDGGVRGAQTCVCECVRECVWDWVEARLGRQYQTVHQCHSACVLCKPFHPSAWKAWLCAGGSPRLFTYSTTWHSNPFL